MTFTVSGRERGMYHYLKSRCEHFIRKVLKGTQNAQDLAEILCAICLGMLASREEGKERARFGAMYI